LREITQSSLNARSSQPRRSRSPRKTVVFKDIDELHNAAFTPSMSSKKRKAYLSPESLPFDSSPCKRACPDEAQEDNIPSSPPDFQPRSSIRLDRSTSPEPRLPPPQIRRIATSNISGKVLERSFGGMQDTGRARWKGNCTC
jgi:hypothetical protein